MAMIILLVLLIFFAALGVPLAFAIGASCVTYITTCLLYTSLCNPKQFLRYPYDFTCCRESRRAVPGSSFFAARPESGMNFHMNPLGDNI